MMGETQGNQDKPFQTNIPIRELPAHPGTHTTAMSFAALLPAGLSHCLAVPASLVGFFFKFNLDINTGSCCTAVTNLMASLPEGKALAANIWGSSCMEQLVPTSSQLSVGIRPTGLPSATS